MPEAWKDIPSYEGFYKVSTRGVVRSYPRLVRSRGGYRMIPARTYKSSPGPHGYLRVMLSRGTVQSRKWCLVHRLVVLAFRGQPPPNTEVRHLNGIVDDVRLCNLVYSTHAVNESDKVAHHTLHYGERHSNSKLDLEKVREIICRWRSGETVTTLSLSYQVSRATVQAVVRGKSWRRALEIDRELTKI